MKTLKHWINPFNATGLFLYPLKTSENLWFSDFFQGVKKETSDTKWLNVLNKYLRVNNKSEQNDVDNLPLVSWLLTSSTLSAPDWCFY